MKAAILCHITERWIEVLPLVMLGIRSTWQKDLEAKSVDKPCDFLENYSLPANQPYYV